LINNQRIVDPTITLDKLEDYRPFHVPENKFLEDTNSPHARAISRPLRDNFSGAK